MVIGMEYEFVPLVWFWLIFYTCYSLEKAVISGTNLISIVICGEYWHIMF